MKKLLLLLAFIYIQAIAHTLNLTVLNNDDNTITVEGGFSTGESAAGALIMLEALSSGEILFKERLPVESELVIQVPNEPYQIVLDGGPGHTVVREGIAPLKGFTKLNKEKKEKRELSVNQSSPNQWTTPDVILFIVVLILLILAIFFSKKNTDKILKEIQKTKEITS